MRRSSLKRRLEDSDEEELPQLLLDEDLIVPSASASSSAALADGNPNRGGLRRRLRDDDDEHGTVAETASGAVAASGAGVGSSRALPFTNLLMRKWCSGKMSSPDVQEEADAAMRQNATGLERLAAIGSGGSKPTHLHRGLVAAFWWPTGAPPFSYVEIPVAVMAKPQPQPFIFPHAFFQALFKESRAYWDESVLCSPEQVKDFWSRSAQDPDIQSHPFLQSARQRRLTVPLGMHGDGGSFFKAGQFICDQLEFYYIW